MYSIGTKMLKIFLCVAAVVVAGKWAAIVWIFFVYAICYIFLHI